MRYLKEAEVYEECVEDRLALEGDLADRLVHLDNLEHYELRRIAIAQIALHRARQANDQTTAMAIIAMAFDEIERLSDQTLSEYLLMEHDIEDMRTLDAVVLKHGAPEFVAHYADVKKRLPAIRAARRVASHRRPALEIVG